MPESWRKFRALAPVVKGHGSGRREPSTMSRYDARFGMDRTANPHPVVNRSPISENPSQERNEGVRNAFSSRGDRFGDTGGLEKPAFRGTNARVSGGVRYLKTGWWCAQSD